MSCNSSTDKITLCGGHTFVSFSPATEMDGGIRGGGGGGGGGGSEGGSVNTGGSFSISG
jgi:hypothetical protein